MKALSPSGDFFAVVALIADFLWPVERITRRRFDPARPMTEQEAKMFNAIGILRG